MRDRLAAGAEALVEEGVTTLELPLTSPGVLDAIARTVDRSATGLSSEPGPCARWTTLVGPWMPGARFLVAPALNVPVVEHALAVDVAVLPGVMTPTEIETARSAGAEIVKLFPAQTLGPAYLGHLRVPFPDLEVVPTAGIGAEDVAAWLAAGAVAVGVGSPLTGRFLEDGRPRRIAGQRPRLEGCGLVTLDVLTYGEAMGVVESERVGPLRLGGAMRMSVAGAESTVAIGRRPARRDRALGRGRR